MTTKNLSRTVIEGGRTGYYKTHVRERAGAERAEARRFLRDATLDPDSALGSCDPVRKPVMADFDDKLGPVYKFLDSRLGRSWDKVRSELFQKFDARTTPGRHVLFDHLLRMVCQDPGAPESAPHRRYASYFVDAQGRLCKEKPRYSRHGGHKPCDLRAVAAWLAGRKVGRAGVGFFWFVPTASARVCTTSEGYAIAYAMADERGEPIRDPAGVRSEAEARMRTALSLGPKTVLRLAHGIRFRQSRRLDAGEEAFLRALPEDALGKILAQAPANV